ncbi:ankyrin, partial [Anaeromyces robustus]
VNAVDQDGNTPLHFLCGNDKYGRTYYSFTLLKFFLNHPEINKNAQNKIGYTPLMVASSQSNGMIVRFLIEYGADINLKSFKNQTALILACHCRSTYIVKMLIDHHAEVDTQDLIYGDTALTIISKYYQKNSNIMKILVEKGHPNVNIANWKGETPLLLACQSNNINNVRLLVENGAE